MREDIAGPQGASSRPMWETLEGMVREKAQEFIQQIMEEEVTELLGPGEVRAREYGGLGRGLPQWIWQAEAAYRRTDLFERRRRLMGDWAAYLAGAPREPEATTPRENAAELR